MTIHKTPPWWFHLAAELAACGIFYGLLKWHDAPTWAIILFFFVCTRASRIAVASDVRAVQSSLRLLVEELGGVFGNEDDGSAS